MSGADTGGERELVLQSLEKLEQQLGSLARERVALRTLLLELDALVSEQAYLGYEEKDDQLLSVLIQFHGDDPKRMCD